MFVELYHNLDILIGEIIDGDKVIVGLCQMMGFASKVVPSFGGGGGGGGTVGRGSNLANERLWDLEDLSVSLELAFHARLHLSLQGLFCRAPLFLVLCQNSRQVVEVAVADA